VERFTVKAVPWFHLYQNAEKVYQSVSFIWFVWLVLFIWLNQTNQIDQMN